MQDWCCPQDMEIGAIWKHEEGPLEQICLGVKGLEWSWGLGRWNWVNAGGDSRFSLCVSLQVSISLHFCLCLCFSLSTHSSCSIGWSWTHCVPEDDLELLILHVQLPTFWVSNLQMLVFPILLKLIVIKASLIEMDCITYFTKYWMPLIAFRIYL